MGDESSLQLTALLVILCICNATLSMSCITSGRAALLKLKQSLTDPSDVLSSWTGSNCCKWTGVTCSNKHNGQVVRLNLGNMSLGGEIGPSLFKLQQLRSLNLSMNDFGGIQIPDFFGSITNMRYLNLSNANFGGEIPHQLGNLSSLVYLDLGSENGIPFPGLHVEDLGWISGLTSLTYLDMSKVSFMSGPSWFESINMIPSLEVLRLSSCLIDSFNPPSLPFFNITSLSILDLSGNNSTLLPRWLPNATHLTSLDLSHNTFTGPIPDALGNMAYLSYLRFRYNQLEGEIPPSFGNLCSLQFLDLSHNSISGPIPSSIGELSSLQHLFLHDNQLNGTLPVGLGQLSTLVALNISRNPLVGVMSEDHFANLTSLTELVVYDTALTFKLSSTWDPPFLLRYLNLPSTPIGSSFPSWLRTQKELVEIELSNTSISDELPHWFWGLTSNCYRVDLSNNQLTGSLPSSLERSNITFLDLSSNQLSGNLLRFGQAIMTLGLSNNKFTGPLPTDMGQMMPWTTHIMIPGNQLSGNVPLSICKMNNLKVLWLEDNHISGTIPDCWKSSQNVLVLDLQNNNLSGGIPGSLGSLASSLGSLHLNNNHLTGEIPTSLKNCTNLLYLDLGQNRLSGSIPSWVGESLSSLLILRLRSNIFTGRIPHSFSALSSLGLLDLANNRLSGVIPIALSNLTAMALTPEDGGFANDISPGFYQDSILVDMKGRELEYKRSLLQVKSMDLSNNQLVGKIPEELRILSGLMVLNLSYNRLEGLIPKEIGNLRWLESLDLSRNSLSGTIPPSILALTFLGHLNLSYNKLRGEIPQGFQLQTLADASIYIGNDGLCGHPLLVACNSPSGPPSAEVGRSDDDDASNMIWFYSGMAPGWAVGFLGIWSMLFLKPSWRFTLFQFTDKVYDWIYVTIVLEVSKLRRSLASTVEAFS